MTEITRRAFAGETLGSLMLFSLLETLYQRDLFGDEVKPLAVQWLAKLDDMGRDLKGRKLTQTEWQTQVEELFGQVELADLLKFLKFDELTKDLQFRDRGERSLRPKLPEVEGLPTNLVYGHQVFALSKGRSVVPHGHNNMATAFLVLKGDFRGRHYDRLEDTAAEIIIRPTIDRGFTTGGVSTVSDQKDNVHWFTAESETGFIFNIHVLNVEAGRSSGRVYLDPNGEKLSGNRIRARRLKAADAYKQFG